MLKPTLKAQGDIFVESYQRAKDARKNGHPEETEQICRAELKKNPDNVFFQDLLSWALYDLFIKGTQLADRAFIEKATEIYNLSSREYSANVRTCFMVSKLLSEVQDWQGALDWLSRINPERLDKTQKPSPDGRKYPSDLEQYFMRKTKILLGLKQFEECKSTCEQALSSDIEFTNDDRIWIEQRLADCLAHTATPVEAIQKYHELLMLRRRWFFFKKIGELSEELGDKIKAKKAYASAIVSPDGEIEKKVTVYERLAYLEDDSVIKKQLLQLVVLIRKHNNWAIRGQLKKELDTTGISVDDPTPLKKLYSQLLPSFLSAIHENEPKKHGIIDKILVPGASGFIRGVSQSYYFNARDFVYPDARFDTGTPVSFYTEMRLNKKKETMEENAVDIMVEE